MKKLLIIVFSCLLLVGCEAKEQSIVDIDKIRESQGRIFKNHAIISDGDNYSLYNTDDSEAYKKAFTFDSDAYKESDIVYATDEYIYIFTDGDLHNEGIEKYDYEGNHISGYKEVYSANIIYGLVDNYLYFSYNTKDGQINYAKVSSDLTDFVVLNSVNDLPSSIIG